MTPEAGPRRWWVPRAAACVCVLREAAAITVSTFEHDFLPSHCHRRCVPQRDLRVQKAASSNVFGSPKLGILESCVSQAFSRTLGGTQCARVNPIVQCPAKPAQPHQHPSYSHPLCPASSHVQSHGGQWLPYSHRQRPRKTAGRSPGNLSPFPEVVSPHPWSWSLGPKRHRAAHWRLLSPPLLSAA